MMSESETFNPCEDTLSEFADSFFTQWIGWFLILSFSEFTQ